MIAIEAVGLRKSFGASRADTVPPGEVPTAPAADGRRVGRRRADPVRALRGWT